MTRGLALVGLVVAGALAQVSPASAQSAEWEPGHPGLTVQSASPGAHPAPAQAVSPTISPAARRVRFVSSYKDYPCPVGNLCVAVWDNVWSSYKVFDLFYCNRYALSNWTGSGSYRNNQTGNVLSIFYDQNLNRIQSFRPDYPDTHIVNWGPVWHIRNC